MTSHADSQRRLHRRLAREALICLALFGVPAIALYPYTHWRPAAEFHATIHTRELTFTTGQDYTGRGLFAGGRADLVFEHFDRVKLPSGEEIKGRRISFRNVSFQALPLVTGAGIVLRWEPSKPAGLSISANYGASYAGGPPSPVRVFWDRNSQAESDSGPLTTASDGNADIYPAPNRTLTISLDAHSEEPKKTGELIFDSGYPVFLSTKVPVLFTQRSGSAIVGFENVVDVLNAGRKQKVLQSQFLRIADLGAESRISDLRIRKDGMIVDVQGTAGTLAVDGRDIRPSPVEYLRSNGILSTWVTMSLLIGSVALTVATRFGLVKLLGKAS
jgi:hypothetical protein